MEQEATPRDVVCQFRRIPWFSSGPWQTSCTAWKAFAGASSWQKVRQRRDQDMGQNETTRIWTAGFSPWFHLSGFHFECPFLTHSHMCVGVCVVGIP